MDKVYPGRRVREPAGFRQIIGEQRHRNAEDGVAQRLQSAHFEKTDLLQPRSPSKPPDTPRGAGPLETRPLLSAVGLSDIDRPFAGKVTGPSQHTSWIQQVATLLGMIIKARWLLLG